MSSNSRWPSVKFKTAKIEGPDAVTIAEIQICVMTNQEYTGSATHAVKMTIDGVESWLPPAQVVKVVLAVLNPA